MASRVRVLTSTAMYFTVCGGGELVAGGVDEKDQVGWSDDAHDRYERSATGSVCPWLKFSRSFITLCPSPRSSRKFVQDASVAVLQLPCRVGEERSQAMRTLRVRYAVLHFVRSD
jgi:hypothetical protein